MKRPAAALPIVPEITHPCTEAWEEMPGTAMVRHCGVCDKDVFNTVAMSAAQIHSLVAGPIPCLRVSRYDDGSLVTLEPAPVSHRSPLAAGVLIAAMSLASAPAQSSSTPTMGVPPLPPRVTISGHITDHAGKALPNLRLTVLKNGYQAEQLATDGHGKFSVQLQPGDYQMVVKGDGFVTRTLPLHAEKTVELTQSIELIHTSPVRSTKKLAKAAPGRRITVTGGRVAPLSLPLENPPAPLLLPSKNAAPQEPTLTAGATRIMSINLGAVEVTAEDGSIPLENAALPLLKR